MNELYSFLDTLGISQGGIVLTITNIVLFLIAAKILIFVCNKSIDRLIASSARFTKNPARAATLATLVKSLIKYSVYIFVAALPILNILHFPLDSLLAVAGLGGVAIGFGAQSLVKDVVTGFFILFEDQYSVGDYVNISGMIGTVDAVELRTTTLIGYGGELYTIPNGEVKTVINHSRGNSTAIIDISVAYEADIDRAMACMLSVANVYKQSNDYVVTEPEMLGLTKLGDSSVTLRLIIKTTPMMHFKTERDLRKAIKDAFSTQGIEIPYNKIVIVNP